MILRLLDSTDTAPLARLFVRNDVPDVTRWFDPFTLDATSAQRLTSYAGADRYWGLWRDEDLVGMTMVRGWDGGYPQRAYGMLIDRGLHGQGLGTAATRLTLEAVQDLGETLVRARVHDDNLGSMTALRRNGYVEIERGDGRVLFEWRATS